MFIDKENAQLSFGWERPTVVTLSSNTPTATTITGFTGLTASALKGQMLRVLSGNQAGAIYWIVDNTTTAVTVEGLQAPNESGDAIADDRVAYSTNGIVPTLSNCNIYLGTVENFTPPTKEQEVADQFSHGSGVTRAYSFVKKIMYNGGSVPVGLQGRPELLLALGRFSCIGSDTGTGGSTLDGDVQAWDTTITLDSTANYSLGDYIQVDVSTNAEVRQIGSVTSGTVLTLDQPLDYNHLDGVACNQVQAPWTYTIYPSATLNRSFTVVRAFGDPYAGENDLIEYWNGNYIESADFSSSEDNELESTLGFRGMTYDRKTDGTSKPTVTVATENPYFWDGSEVSYNSISAAVIREFSGNWSWELEDVRAHGGKSTKEPYRIYRKRPSFTGEYTYIPVSDTLKAYGDVSTEYDSYVKLIRSTNDYLKLTFVDSVVIKDDWPSPDSGYVNANHSMSPEQINLEIKIDDTAPMY